MKLIEALKKIKDLNRKAEDIRKKIRDHAADLDYETPVYGNQAGQVQEWLQAHSDILKEILRLRIAIQKTNLNSNVTIEIGGKSVTKSIAEWVHRRRDLASMESDAWRSLSDKGLKEGTIKQSNGEMREVKLRRYYSPLERDKKLEVLISEPSITDSILEVVNAVTDLQE